MRKFKILLVHNYYQIPGGEDSVVANEKRMLEEHGHEVLLYSRHNDEINSFTIHQKLLLPFSLIFNLKTYFDIKRIIKEKNIDVVHVHNTLSLISPSVFYAAKACSVPVFQTIHNFRMLCPSALLYRDGQICEECISYGLGCAVKHSCYRGSKLQTIACIINTCIHRFSGIYKSVYYICLTEFNKNKLLQLKQIPAKHVFVKPNFIENNLALVQDKDREEQYVFAGRLDKSKGIDLLFQVWEEMGDSAPRLVVCGSGPMDDWCKDFVNCHKVNIELKGRLSNEDARRLIGSSLALILPTQWYEGFPMSIVEAFSVGTPVICSDIGNPGDIVQEGVTGCKFDPKSVSDIVFALQRYQESPSMYASTLQEYVTKYTSDINYEKLMSIYRNLDIP